MDKPRFFLAVLSSFACALLGIVVAGIAVAPYTTTGLLAVALFLAWFIACEDSIAHESNEIEDYVKAVLALSFFVVIFYAPDSLLASAGLGPLVIACPLAFNIYSRRKHRQALGRAGDAMKHWPRTNPSMDDLDRAHISGLNRRLQEQLAQIDLMLIPTFYNSLVRFATVMRCEAAIYDIFADESLSGEELSALILQARISLLLYKVKDHTVLARAWGLLRWLFHRRGLRRHPRPEAPRLAFESRTNLIRLLAHARLCDLSLPARAMVADGLTTVSCPAAERALENIILKTFGMELTFLKNLCDSKGTHRSLHYIVFSCVSAPSIRAEVLFHLRYQAAHVLQQIRGKGHQRRFRKVMSDVDDTFVCSGGHYPAGIDQRLHKKEIYPGAPSFLRHLDQSFGFYSRFSKLTGGKKIGNIAFLSARPHVYKGYAEDYTLKKLANLVDTGYLHCIPTILCGSIGSGKAFIVKSELEPMARKKFENFLEYTQLYPEYTFVFIGDNGQADLRAALLMLERIPDLIEAAFIHVVQPVECGYGYAGYQSLAPRSRDKVVFFRNYVEAGIGAVRRGLFTGDDLGELLCSVCKEFTSCSFFTARARELMRVEINEAARAVEALWQSQNDADGARPWCQPFQPIEASQEFMESEEVSTPYGTGRVIGFRPEDGIYTVRFPGWNATAFVYMLHLEALPRQRRFGVWRR